MKFTGLKYIQYHMTRGEENEKDMWNFKNIPLILRMIPVKRMNYKYSKCKLKSLKHQTWTKMKSPSLSVGRQSFCFKVHFFNLLQKQNIYTPLYIFHSLLLFCIYLLFWAHNVFPPTEKKNCLKYYYWLN